MRNFWNHCGRGDKIFFVFMAVWDVAALAFFLWYFGYYGGH